MFSQILVTIGQIVEKWKQFLKIQDGGRRHGGFLDRRPLIVNLKVPNSQKARISIGT